MASSLYSPARRAFGRGQIAWDTDDIRGLLVLPTYSYDADHQYVSDVVAHELGATNYARKQLTGRSVGVSAPTYFLADTITWTSLGNGVNETIHGLIIFVHTGNDATAPLICFCDNADLPTQGQETRIVFANNRVFSWSG
jgi:hypothetical protein